MLKAKPASHIFRSLRHRFERYMISYLGVAKGEELRWLSCKVASVLTAERKHKPRRKSITCNALNTPTIGRSRTLDTKMYTPRLNGLQK